MKLFTYGSLMFPEVWERVTGLTRPGLPARLHNYAARRLRGQTYPALIAAPGSLTEGILYQEIPAAAMARLDDFEGSFYHRALVGIVMADGAASSAWVYLASDPGDPEILPEPWNATRFAGENLPAFLQHDPGFNGGR